MEPQPWMSPNPIFLLVKFTKYFQAKRDWVQTNIVWFFTFDDEPLVLILKNLN
jgi:hypothetical protein